MIHLILAYSLKVIQYQSKLMQFLYDLYQNLTIYSTILTLMAIKFPHDQFILYSFFLFTIILQPYVNNH